MLDAYSPDITPWLGYGALKVLCECEANERFPGRTLVLRPGYIVGPGDVQGYFNYWPARFAAGGEVLVAGDPSVPAQIVDVRDMAEWTLRMVEKRATGVYNTVGPAAFTTLAQVITAAAEVTATSPKITWVPPEWLARPDKDMWLRVLFWSGFERENYGSMQMKIDRELAQGFTTRPLEVTFADAFKWYSSQAAESSVRQLDKVQLNEDKSGATRMPIPWDHYVAREKEVLAAWRARRS